MSNIDKIRQEIEKRLKNTRDYMNGAGMKYKGPKYYKAQGKESAYDALLSLIDSCPSFCGHPDPVGEPGENGWPTLDIGPRVPEGPKGPSGHPDPPGKGLSDFIQDSLDAIERIYNLDGKDRDVVCNLKHILLSMLVITISLGYEDLHGKTAKLLDQIIK